MKVRIVPVTDLIWPQFLMKVVKGIEFINMWPVPRFEPVQKWEPVTRSIRKSVGNRNQPDFLIVLVTRCNCELQSNKLQRFYFYTRPTLRFPRAWCFYKVAMWPVTTDLRFPLFLLVKAYTPGQSRYMQLIGKPVACDRLRKGLFSIVVNFPL